jgi:hypothetical protein
MVKGVCGPGKRRQLLTVAVDCAIRPAKPWTGLLAADEDLAGEGGN